MKHLLSLIILFIGTFHAHCQTLYTENTLKLTGTSQQASIEDMSWLEGHWIGEAFGGVGEEIWTEPMGGAMMGMYRSVKEDTVNFYEFMIIREVENTIILQIKHFNRDLTGWEEKDETVEFPFIKKEGDRVYFDGFTFERNNNNQLTIYLVIGSGKDGSLSEYVFPYQRKGAD